MAYTIWLKWLYEAIIAYQFTRCDEFNSSDTQIYLSFENEYGNA